MRTTDTIAAISTAMNPGGIGIVRISGSDSIAVADKIYRGSMKLSERPGHTINYGYIYDGDERVDQVLVMLMKAPHTYTGEDVVEIDCHGGMLVLQKVLGLVIRAGAVPAEPGEFTKRAFLNGKMDLSQAEAVLDIIEADNYRALKNGEDQLGGKLSGRIKNMRDILLHEIAYIEAALDDPEHYDLSGYPELVLSPILNGLTEEASELLRDADAGIYMKSGINTVILGRPNAGKSSIYNLLAGTDRAIVTEIAGTTRDTLTDNIRLSGLSLNITDTAGLRETEDVVEKIGVERARNAADKADLILYVIDASEPLSHDDMMVLETLNEKKTIILLNKTDLGQSEDISARYNTSDTAPESDSKSASVMKSVMASVMVSETASGTVSGTVSGTSSERASEIPAVSFSAKTGEGRAKLIKLIEQMFYNGKLESSDAVFITSVRHKEALVEAKASMELVLSGIELSMPEDLLAIDLMNAYEALGQITGETVGEEVIDKIFSEFCMGK